MLLALTLTLSLQATPLPQEPSSAVTDVVRLKVGTELTGRITAQTDSHVFVEVGPGNVVGFSMDQVSTIVRGAAAHREPAVPDDAPPWFRERDEWFILHDARGRGIGNLHEMATRDDLGRVRLVEEWRFSSAERLTEITRLEVCGVDDVVESTFCHERTFGPDQRLIDERVVRGVVGAGQIAVTSRTGRGDRRTTYELGSGTRFPLELRARLRVRPIGAYAEEHHPVYDTLEERFVATSWDVGRVRRVPGESGDVLRVRVLVTPDGEEWLDKAGRTLRREINGPALVAVPVSEADARRLATGDHFPVGLRAEPAGRFAMWLPNPAWDFEPGETPGQITARGRADDAAVSLVRFDHLESALGLDSAAEAVVRWIALVQPDFRVFQRERMTLRDAPAALLRARFVAKDASGSPRAFECVTLVLRAGDSWYAVCGSAPRGLFAQVESDIVWMAAHIELDPNGFAPPVEGAVRPPARTARR